MSRGDRGTPPNRRRKSERSPRGFLFGALPGATEPLRKIPSLSARLEPAQRRWLVRSALFLGLFVALVTDLILSSHRTLFGG
ncbi:MAG: hypothetical protein HZB55_02395 [Deltaproteobacteria bacterium]|nr:hypothetical protein [Deltaproteobacteria bacterium]